MRHPNVKQLRIYHKDHLSYKKLREKEFFSFIENLNSEKEKEIVLEVVLLLVRGINIFDRLTNTELTKKINLNFKLVEVSRRHELENSTKKSFITSFISVYRSKNYVNEFRGDIVEYIVVYLKKSSSSKLLHEPIFRLKRKRLVSSKVVGFDCLVDVVKISKKYHRMDLYECKANLDTCITYINKGKRKFKRKLSYMNALEYQLTKIHYNDNNDKVHVTKNLVSLITPRLSIPPKYKKFNQIDLLRDLKLGKANY